MDWMSQLSGVLQQYSGAGAAPARSSVPDDFDQIAQTAPKSELADGLAAAFRSDETPEFGKMAEQLFSNSNGEQRAGILNTLIRAAGSDDSFTGLIAPIRIKRRRGSIQCDRHVNSWATDGDHTGAS